MGFLVPSCLVIENFSVLSISIEVLDLGVTGTCHSGLNSPVLMSPDLTEDHITVTIMCRNDELSWLFTKRFRAFYLICRKYPKPFQNFFYSHSPNFHLFGSNCSVKIVTREKIALELLRK